ncbi:hypothetical protein [Aliikangiella coralliicola]|uniref:Uncharacterized protein n=1 Tax=Aliikangiella coralliicola TaxID=2592383 RepID=A0A545UBT4_9GAMM|nr:hypothetical protein [Aliikangiella coralliicola]TQV86926.1 hypothetical protein FLL46_14015 [Aliikangiella coralliicola]
MRQVRQTLWNLFSHSWITLIAITILTIVFVSFQLIIYVAEIQQSDAFKASTMTNLVLACFWGIYIGGALLRLKQYYLWKINQCFRQTLVTTYLGLLGVFNLLLIFPAYLNINSNHSPLVLVAPFCVSIFASQVVLAKSLILRAIVPVTPFIIGQLYWLNVDESLIMLLIIASTCGLIYYLYQSSSYRRTEPQDMVFPVASQSTGFKPSIVFKFNYFISLMIANHITKNKKNVSWSILLPHSKLAIFSFFYVLLIFVFLIFLGGAKKSMLEVFTLIFISTSLIAIVMEARQLLPQVKLFSHVFTEVDHRRLKNKILISLDKAFTYNGLIFITGAFLVGQLLSLESDALYFFSASIATLLIAMALHPLLLCLTWINVSLTQILVVSVYFLAIFFVSGWIEANHNSLFYSWEVLLFFICLVITRTLAQVLFWKKPLEKLLKTK